MNKPCEKKSNFQSCHVIFEFSSFQQKNYQTQKEIRKGGRTQEKKSLLTVAEKTQKFYLTKTLHQLL